MEKENQNEKILSRRGFFKDVAKKALPILGAVALINVPTITKATESTQVRCTTCMGSCEGCGNSCAESCVGKCKGTCKGTCEGTCDKTCTGGCDKTCTGGCNRASRWND